MSRSRLIHDWYSPYLLNPQPLPPKDWYRFYAYGL
jgi:hypothetical protein